MKGKCSTNIIRVPALKGSDKEKVRHPSQKPMTLVEKLITSSSRRGDIVLDPFIGSGTTAVVAESAGRKWIGIEKESKYIVMTKKTFEVSWQASQLKPFGADKAELVLPRCFFLIILHNNWQSIQQLVV